MNDFSIHDFGDRQTEECGVFGAFVPGENDPLRSSIGRLSYYGLYSLQHRGQESAGLVVCDGDSFTHHRGMGLVAEVFSDTLLDGLNGHAAIGHVRYSTAGSSSIANAQPLLAESRLGKIAIAHNGNLVNAPVIRELLEDAGVMFQTSSDSEVILNLIARGARRGINRALTDAMRAIQGAFSLVVLTGDALVAVRDPKGIRPLVLGELGDASIVASETCSLDAVGATYVRDVHPGEILIISDDGIESIMQNEQTENRVCSFEFVYFSRPDSQVDGVSVYASRMEAGRILFEESPVDADVVSGVPDSGVVAAHGFAEAAGVPYAMTLIKNKYVGRSFIAPTQELRERAVSVKLNVLRANVTGKRVVLIDDSIVRGTTMRRLVRMLRSAGALEVHIRIASPPVRYPCYFGMDYPSREELAGRRSVDEVCAEIGADTLAYLSLAGLHRSLGGSGHFCTGCLTGVYPVAAPVEQEKEALAEPEEKPTVIDWDTLVRRGDGA
jgi:amidophosphoribosyltransferase